MQKVPRDPGTSIWHDLNPWCYGGWLRQDERKAGFLGGLLSKKPQAFIDYQHRLELLTCVLEPCERDSTSGWQCYSIRHSVEWKFSERVIPNRFAKL